MKMNDKNAPGEYRLGFLR